MAKKTLNPSPKPATVEPGEPPSSVRPLTRRDTNDSRRLKGKGIRFVHKFVQMKRVLWESGQIEIFNLESGAVLLAGKVSIPAVSEKELWFGRVLDATAAIADYFGIDLKWPREITETDIELLVLLKWMIEKKSYGTGARFTGVLTKTNENRDLFELWKAGGSMCITRGEPLVLLGAAIEGYTIAYCFDQTKILEFERSKDRFDRAAVGDQIEVKYEAQGDIWIRLWDMKESRPVEKPNQPDQSELRSSRRLAKEPPSLGS